MQHLIDTRPAHSTFEPLHEVRDETKLAALIESMRVNGWQGAPLLVEGDCAITGSHRIAAVNALFGTDDEVEEIPFVEVSDFAAEYGVDWDALREQYDYLDEAAQALAERIPAEDRDIIGLDVH